MVVTGRLPARQPRPVLPDLRGGPRPGADRRGEGCVRSLPGAARLPEVRPGRRAGAGSVGWHERGRAPPAAPARGQGARARAAGRPGRRAPAPGAAAELTDADV